MELVSRRQAGWIPETEGERAAVIDQLELLLKSPHFRNSKRYSAFLGFVVRETLTGNGDSLKERTLGIEVFHRSPDYDTNTDPIVRVTAGEIRKRLAQCYQDEPGAEIRIDLPPGSYVPVLRRAEIRTDETTDGETEVTGSAAERAYRATQAIKLPETVRNTGPVDSGIERRDSTSTRNETTEAPSSVAAVPPSARKGRIMLWIGAVAVLLVCIGAGYLSSYLGNPMNQMWRPIFASHAPVLLLVGQPRMIATAESASDNVFSHQHEASNTIFLSGGITIGRICSMIGGRAYYIVPSRSTAISELRKRPLVLIGAFDNPWTMRLLKPLRFSFQIDGNGDSGISPQILEIVDRKHQSGSPWVVDTNQPIGTMAHDYAIIARFHDETTEGPIVVAAGIGSTGTESAGEFITSPSYMKELGAKAPRDWSRKNMEAVIETEIIDGHAGHPHVVAVEFW